jgi:hypothetical protein
MRIRQDAQQSMHGYLQTLQRIQQQPKNDDTAETMCSSRTCRADPDESL